MSVRDVCEQLEAEAAELRAMIGDDPDAEYIKGSALAALAELKASMLVCGGAVLRAMDKAMEHLRKHDGD